MGPGSDEQSTKQAAAARPRSTAADRYQWVALTNTTMAVFMSSLDGMIILIALPAIFNGIHLDPLAPANIGYLLWMIMGYRLVQAVFVVNLGRLGDILGRVRIYNLGFVVFTVASILLSLDPFTGSQAALWLIGWRFLQAFGGSMLAANSAAILTDAFPPERRGFALGVNQTAILAGQFIGLTAGGLLAAWDWRAVFWVNVPVGVAGTLWAYFRLRDNGARNPARIDWWGNATFAIGLSAVLIAVTYGIQSYGGRTMGWSNPAVIAGLASALPRTLTSGLARHGVTHQVAAQIGRLPPVSSLFAAMLGVDPVHYLLSQYGALSSLTPANRNLLTGREFFPSLISGPFHDGLVLVFAVSAALGVIAAAVSLMRGTSRRRPVLTPRPSSPQGAAPMPLTTLDPTPALVVIDLQKGIVADPVAHVVAPAASLAKSFRQHDLPVVLITKRRRSAFHDTGLDTLLRDLGVTQVVLAGVSTSAGVESTARSAHDHGYHVVLATDAMADQDPDSHRHSIERVFPKLGETATSTEIIGLLDRTASQTRK